MSEWDIYLVDFFQNVLLRQVNGILHTWRCFAFDKVTGEISQDDFFDGVPGFVEIQIVDVWIFPAWAHIGAIEEKQNVFLDMYILVKKSSFWVMILEQYKKITLKKVFNSIKIA